MRARAGADLLPDADGDRLQLFHEPCVDRSFGLCEHLQSPFAGREQNDKHGVFRGS